jgi:hypothetical protein
MSKKSESDPSGLDQHVKGAKLDAGKLNIFKMVLGYFAPALRAVGWLSNTGAIKYTYGGWSAVDNAEERYLEAEVRHLFDLAEGKEYDLVYTDPKSGREYWHHHKVSKAWNALAELTKFIEAGGVTEKIVEK